MPIRTDRVVAAASVFPHKPRLCVFLAVISLLVPALEASAQTTALRAGDFLNSIGACTHMTQGVDDPARVATALSFCGIRNIRDDGSTNATTLQKFITVHNACGAKVSLLSVNGNIAGCLTEYETLADAGALLAAEGPNEPNNWPVTYGGQTSSSTTSLPIAQFQKDLYAAVKADAALAHIPVFHSSEAGGSEPDNCGLQFLTIPGNASTKMPDNTIFADYANTHNYVCDHLTGISEDNIAWDAEDPTLNGKWDGLYVEYGRTWWSPGYNGYTNSQLAALPRVTTETGWVTSGTDAITEDQQGRLFMDLYVSAFKRGWSYTFVYMLHDDAGQGFWGFVHTDYTNKLSATYLHNLTSVLADTASSFTPGALSYSIANQPAAVHDLLLQKGNGTMDLVVWGEAATGSNTVSMALGSTVAAVKVYDPVQGAAAIQTLGAVSSVSVTLSDHPVIIEIPNATGTVKLDRVVTGAREPDSPSAVLSATSGRIQYLVPKSRNAMTGVYDVHGRLVKMQAGVVHNY